MDAERSIQELRAMLERAEEVLDRHGLGGVILTILAVAYRTLTSAAGCSSTDHPKCFRRPTLGHPGSTKQGLWSQQF